jgi:hypothetical protein
VWRWKRSCAAPASERLVAARLRQAVEYICLHGDGTEICRFRVKLPRELHRKVSIIAEKEGLSVGGVIYRALSSARKLHKKEVTQA